MLPELLKFVDEGVLQVIKRREHGIGEGFTQVSKDLLSGIEFGTVGWQIEWMHVLGPSNLPTVMTARTVEHDSDRSRSQLVAQMPQEELQAVAFHARQQEEDTGASGGLHGRVEPEPLVLLLHDPRGTFPQGTPASTKPGDQAKAALIEGDDSRKLRLLDQGSEVFLKAVCCSALAFLCRRRPVFHLTRCFLKSHQSDLPFL
jgi:hypothetical protein